MLCLSECIVQRCRTHMQVNLQPGKTKLMLSGVSDALRQIFQQDYQKLISFLWMGKSCDILRIKVTLAITCTSAGCMR